jgi:hypothetical protein
MARIKPRIQHGNTERYVIWRYAHVAAHACSRYRQRNIEQVIGFIADVVRDCPPTNRAVDDRLRTAIHYDMVLRT